MHITFLKESKLLFGKIMVAKKPVFDLDKFRDLDQARTTIEEDLDVIITPLFVKPPKKGTVLGSDKYTIRTNDAVFIPGKEPEILDHLNFGFGEKGYYYDISLRKGNMEFGEFVKKLEETILIVNEFETNIEKGLESLKISRPGVKPQLQPISNFQASFRLSEDEPPEKIQMMQEVCALLGEQSDPAVPGEKNFCFPKLSFNLVSEMVFQSPQLTREYGIPLERERGLSLQKILGSKSYWRLTSRGVPIRTVIKCLKLLFE